MIRKNFKLSDNHQKQLNEMKKKTGANESELVRRAINAYYEKVMGWEYPITGLGEK